MRATHPSSNLRVLTPALIIHCGSHNLIDAHETCLFGQSEMTRQAIINFKHPLITIVKGAPTIVNRHGRKLAKTNNHRLSTFSRRHVCLLITAVRDMNFSVFFVIIHF